MRMSAARSLAVVAALLVSSTLPQARADVTLPKVIGSHMVLQRDRPLPIWGWADPGEEVTVKLDDATATAKADDQGNWKVVLPAVKADGKAHTHDHQRQEQDRAGRHPHRRGLDRLRAVEHGVPACRCARRQGGDRRRQLSADSPACTSRRCRRPNRPRTSSSRREAAGSNSRPGRSARRRPCPTSPPCSTTSASGCTRNSTCPWA